MRDIGRIIVYPVLYLTNVSLCASSVLGKDLNFASNNAAERIGFLSEMDGRRSPGDEKRGDIISKSPSPLARKDGLSRGAIVSGRLDSLDRVEVDRENWIVRRGLLGKRDVPR
ncbi:hypothetical protein HZH68_006475 [Vespula germanica]|uniref:Uncharacterized protein n=1 Tax=Vespula germanica TaxID=30212 RepID=A0A834KGQ2_VESGE|nr:hypothetical protein HZH68_006475 [Vespula germanica]